MTRNAFQKICASYTRTFHLTVKAIMYDINWLCTLIEITPDNRTNTANTETNQKSYTQ